MKRATFKSSLAMLFIAICFLLGAQSCVRGDSDTKPQYNIIVISWDGVQRNHLMQLFDEVRLPNLAKLSTEGKLIPIDVTTHTTDTKAGHTQMLTGYKPETTGVYNNARFGPIPEGYSIFERLENHYGDKNIETIMLTGKSGHIGSSPAGECPKKKNQGKKRKKIAEAKQCPAEPWNIVKSNMDIWDGDKQRDADEVGPKALQYIKEHSDQPFFFFLHFSDPDHAGHKFGENSPQYEKGITDCDKWLGKVRQQLKDSQIADKTLIYVTSDHGFDEGLKSHKNAPYVWLVTNDAGITSASGDQMDIVPTILKRLGIPAADNLPQLPGKTLF